LEAIAVAPSTCPLAGATLLFAERSLDHHGNNRAWIADGPLAGSFSLRRSEDFNVTDATFLADCDLLVLERKFDFSEGLAMRLRRIAGGDLKPGATVDSKVLIEANLADQIDNMEGLAVRKDDRGETLIDMVSDDNQSVLQRTILLQFAIVE